MKRLLVAALLAGCGDTGQPGIEHPAVAIGTAPRPIEIGDYRIQLEVARVAFGPATFCASRASSDEQCPAAVAELTSVTAFDALSGSAQPLGTARGFVGTIRSAGYGYGITWLATQPQPVPAAATPGRHSAHLEGRVDNRVSGATFRFVADADVLPLNRAQYAVSATTLDAAIDERTARLEVRVDPSAWLAQIDFAALEAAGAATVTVAPNDKAANAIVVGMTSLSPPKFVWSR